MSKQVNVETGEVYISSIKKFIKPSVGLDTGSMIVQHKEFSWDDKRRDFVIVDGAKEDKQAFIDSFKDDCGVYNVLKKYSLTGDASLLQKGAAMYGDISDLPVDELNPAALSAKAQDMVSSLNKKLGQNLSMDQLASMSTEELNKLIAQATLAKTAKEDVKTEVKEGE